MEQKTKAEEEADIESVRIYTVEKLANALKDVSDTFGSIKSEISVFVFCAGLGQGWADIFRQTIKGLDNVHPSASKIFMQQIRSIVEEE